MVLSEVCLWLCIVAHNLSVCELLCVKFILSACVTKECFTNSDLVLHLEDFPEGTWLGDENNPQMRVRCPVSAADMLHVTTNCRTAEKMALTLLDYLFHREVQAMSNLSGQGKHGKKQLDPLMIYGIRCESSWTDITVDGSTKCSIFWLHSLASSL